MKHRDKQQCTPSPSFTFLLICGFCLLVLLAACGQTGASGPTPVASRSTSVPTPGVTGTAQRPTQRTPLPNTNTPVAGTGGVPATQTDCPAPRTARAMVTATLAPGTHQTIVYVVNQSSSLSPTLATLKRYDVTTGATVDIVTLPNVSISHAQLSPDGAWILFTATDKLEGIKLQVVRLDGQGLQTLYCSAPPGLDSFQWSPTQQFIAFTDGGPGNAQESVYLLDVASGSLQTEVSPPGPAFSLVVRTWPDNSRIYLTDKPQIAAGLFSKLYLLDTRKGANQPFSTLAIVAQGAFNEFDSAPDGPLLFLASGGCSQGNCSTPTTIVALPITGGASHTILTSAAYTIQQVRAIGGNKLLLIIANSTSGKNGLWIMHTDGSALQQLTVDDYYHYSMLNAFGQYTWSNVSGDGTMYALITGRPGGGNTSYTLLYGRLTGGATTPFATAPDGNNMTLEIVGWTTT